ncbi:hypothetical protein BCR24_14900 [Enterococcus ureilyticus]|uniref:Type VII secretion protein EssA n=1 Tax=Enterococcus ureilyticus TaxID=1131292 RepID=A0A1E5HC99_9ENTE|nr:hypothetical protein [Enterococcus ureilyticus]MBM7690364.1 cobalamin biosynthesis Mg chelatase CobN [Enterococcus ureilyticus]MBO0447525.1 hypothetical protein [Enterococcus ureilyticus]OEG22564.1 hypothetical protein BCR24_14900 [Enterococcus ureilyticus]
MKKRMSLFLLGISLISFSVTANAEETLLDNNLELQTDRLNKEQVDDGKTKSFVAEDRLFEAEMIQKTSDAKALEEKQKQEDMSKLFLTKATKVKELDATQLFAGTEQNQAAVKKEETVSTVSSPPALFPLILGLALVTVVTLLLYHNRKRGQTHGG